MDNRIVNEVEVDAIVRGVRELAVRARAAEEGWRPAVELDADGETPVYAGPEDERAVLVFENGHVALTDFEGRRGGGWGASIGYFDRGVWAWRVRGRPSEHVTHWREMPPPPGRPGVGGAGDGHDAG